MQIWENELIYKTPIMEERVEMNSVTTTDKNNGLF